MPASRPSLYLPTDRQMLALRQEQEADLTFEAAYQVGAAMSGPWPGKNLLDAIYRVRGELGDPYTSSLPLLPARAFTATLLARSLAVLEGLQADVTAEGWRVTEGYAAPSQAARSLLASDINALADVVGSEKSPNQQPLTLTLLGPISLAAQTVLTNGEALISDAGARRDLAQSLLAGLPALISQLAQAAPGQTVRILWQEPQLAQALDGTLPSSSGYRTWRALDRREVLGLLEDVTQQLADLGAEAIMALDYPALAPEIQAAIPALQVPVDQLTTRQWEPLAALIESGRPLYAQALHPLYYRPAGETAQKLWSTWRDLGLPKEALPSLTLLELPGLEASEPARASSLLAQVRETARALSEIAQDS